MAPSGPGVLQNLGVVPQVGWLVLRLGAEAMVN